MADLAGWDFVVRNGPGWTTDCLQIVRRSKIGCRFGGRFVKVVVKFFRKFVNFCRKFFANFVVKFFVKVVRSS